MRAFEPRVTQSAFYRVSATVPGRIVSCRVTTPRPRNSASRRAERGTMRRLGTTTARAHESARRGAPKGHGCVYLKPKSKKTCDQGALLVVSSFVLEAAYVTARFHTMGPGTIPHYDNHDHPDALSCFPSAVANAGRFPEELFGDWKNGRNVSCFSSSASPP